MKKIILLLLCVFCAICLCAFYLLSPKKPTATINGHVFSLEIVTSLKDQEIGLAKYTSLPQNRGMYFPFTNPAYISFWMKNMHFPIDIIFIYKNKIITIYSHVPAPKKGQVFLPTYSPTSPTDGVLEINAGLSKKYGFKVGDKVELFDE